MKCKQLALILHDIVTHV